MGEVVTGEASGFRSGQVSSEGI